VLGFTHTTEVLITERKNVILALKTEYVPTTKRKPWRWRVVVAKDAGTINVLQHFAFTTEIHQRKSFISVKILDGGKSLKKLKNATYCVLIVTQKNISRGTTNPEVTQ
jgi:hypothetical protein